MLTTLVFLSVTAVILYSLIYLTEKALASRKHPVEKDVRIIDHRSRL